MRSLSFRSLFLLLMGTPVLVTTLVLGGVTYRAASGFLVRDALRAVGIAANAREQALVSRLRRQQERALSFLRVLSSECTAAQGPARVRCLEEGLTDFMATEQALGARLLLPQQEFLQVGEPSRVLGPLVSLPAPQLARFEPPQGLERAYELVAERGGMRLGLRFSLERINSLFAERYGLGESGETFLADAQGFFITQPRYPGHSGESHPIDALPMRECLAGRDSEVLGLDYRGATVMHGFRYIEEIGGGCIMAHIEWAEAFAPAHALGMRLAQMTAVLVLGVGGLSFLFARRLSLPVQRLTRTARALQAGDFDVEVPLEGPQELGTFAATFARMARSLQESNQERARLLEREQQARAEAEAQKVLLRLIIEQSGEGIIMADAQGVLRVLNPAAERHHGAPLREVAAAEWARTYGLLSLEGEPLALEQTPLYRAVQGESVTQVRWRVRWPDGQLRTLEGTSAPLRHPDGSSAGGVLITHDVTAQREAELERERLVQALGAEQRRLEEAVRIREDVVAVVSHDLRNPISAISLSTRALRKREGLADGVLKGLSRIDAAAERALRLIRDLLDFTQARVGQLPVEPRPLDFHELVRHVVEEVQLAHPERELVTRAEGDAHGDGDADRMAQVLTNLVGNAVQHSPEGSRVRVESRGVGDEVLLEVHNEGPPIPAEVLPTLFEPFRRGEGARGGSQGSVGLGLFISVRIVEAHAGSIEVRSVQGQGTTFTVRLPRAQTRARST